MSSTLQSLQNSKTMSRKTFKSPCDNASRLESLTNSEEFGTHGLVSRLSILSKRLERMKNLSSYVGYWLERTILMAFSRLEFVHSLASR